MHRPEGSKLKPRSAIHLARKLFHMALGSAVVLIYSMGLDRSTGVVILGCVLVVGLGVEFTRLKYAWFNERLLQIFGIFMRQSEVGQLSGVPYYVSAAILAVGIFPKTIAILSLAYLAYGDPVASLVGIRFGHLGPRFSNGKTLIGTLGGVGVCFLASLIILSSQSLPFWNLLVLSLVGGLAGGLTELLPLEVDDNFSIPLVSGFALWLSFLILGV